MIDWLTLLIFALATWRISSLLVKEEGPFGVFRKIRFASGIHHEIQRGAGNVLLIVPENFFAQVLSCVWCCSIYIGLLWTALYFFFPVLAPWIALPFALSAAAILVNLLVEKLK